MPTSPAPIDTAKVTDRRHLRFNTPDELLADVQRLVAAEKTGTLRHTGNWTLGQTLGHLAFWVNTAYDGHPLKPPWFIKLILRLRKKRFLTRGMPTGVRIPKVEGGTLATDALPVDEGLVRFTKAWDRMKSQPPTQPNIIFGPLTHDEWITLNLGHAALHLSFQHPG